ncbi:MAG: hypothetical protein KJ571_02145 [Bacteroidetes bacterium]|nr:hypothetical protein [Bacteroidota bacterium]
MRKIIIIFFAFAFLLSINAQKHDGPMRDSKFRQRIEQLEKLKLIEVLNMDEETTLKFFARQNKHRDDNLKLEEQRENLVDQLEAYFTSGKELPKGEDFESFNKKVLEIDKKMINHRIEFLKSLNDLLSEEQISKLIVFEFKFRREIRDLILNKRGGGPAR